MNKTIIFVISVIVVGGLAFYGGIQYDKSTGTAGGGSQSGSQARQGGFIPGSAMAGANRRNGAGGGLTNGSILNKDDKSITLQLTAGGSKIIFYSPSTAIMKTTDGTAADLVVGKTVSVNGAANTDGSINATNIQLRPANFQFGTQQRPGGTQQVPVLPKSGTPANQ